MSTIQFHGHVHPTTIPISINDYTIDLHDDQFGDIKLVVKIQESVVNVACTSGPESSGKESSIFFRVLQVTQALVDLGGFAVGAGFDVVLTEVTPDDGRPRGWIEYRQDYLAKINSVISMQDKSFNALFDILCEHPAVLFALYDLKLALTHKIQQPTHCARAIESLRNYFTSDDDRSAGWKLMRESLNFSKPYVEFVTNQSKGPRHGSILDVTAEESKTALERTWTIANRFFELLKRGDKGLPLSEFPLL
jgi:hypothetical protein